ncbi:MAG: isoleucine--tRNA ligase [Bdellovibrionales bacterium]
MTQKPDYKSTVRLPITDFPMKGNLNVKEPEIIKGWRDKKIYQKLLQKNQKGKTFSLPDGPPYANGSIHMGHTLNKCLKDIIIKYKNLQGFQAPFIPGWDCHGLPIEHKVLKDLQEKKQTKSDQEILGLCRAEAREWIGHQQEQFERLGVLADWENPYLTMSPDYEAETIREFARMYDKGLVYRGVKPVYWNWVLKTALAEAEVEYHNHKSPSIYVKFKVEDSATLKFLGSPTKPTSFVIWTTTPWTLPANVAICLHPDFEYGVFDAGSENLVIAKNLQVFVEKETGLSLQFISSFKGAQAERLKARHPWLQRDSILVLGDHVTQETGTGCVHTAPGHGADDFKVGQKYGLPVLCPVNDSGAFTDGVPEWAGQNIFKANPLIIEKLKSLGVLLSAKEIEHSYPHGWRSKTPLIFRTTPQWFLGLDLEQSQLRKKTLASLDQVGFFPEWGKARFIAMMEGRPDWCLSRQRIWGVPIPFYYCKKTGRVLADVKIMMKIADLVEKNGGIEAYWKTPPEQVVGDFSPQADGFGSEGFVHGKDILDVWFDSGVMHALVLKRRPGMAFPADLYLEGSDQHRGWFNSSMLASQAVNGAPPYKNLLTHGFVTDSKGYKMSKSAGNGVDPMDIAGQNGAEILRLWVASADYGQDVPYGKEDLARVTEVYRRFRNTFRYILGAVSDFNPETDRIAYEKMTDVDRWALHQTAVLVETVTKAYDDLEFHRVYHALNQFFTVTLSSMYLDILKDRLYTWKPNGVPRRSAQTVLYDMTSILLRIMAPITSFLSEEAYGYFKGKTQESIFLEPYPTLPASWKNEKLAATFELALKARSDVQKKLEELRAAKTIGSSLEAAVRISADGALYESLKGMQDLREFLIVSVVDLQEGPYNLETRKADGEKCERCWVYSTDIGSDSKLPGVCPKCVEALT